MCSICQQLEEKLQSMRNYPPAFIEGTTNVKAYTFNLFGCWWLPWHLQWQTTCNLKNVMSNYIAIASKPINTVSYLYIGILNCDWVVLCLYQRCYLLSCLGREWCTRTVMSPTAALNVRFCPRIGLSSPFTSDTFSISNCAAWMCRSLSHFPARRSLLVMFISLPQQFTFK